MQVTETTKPDYGHLLPDRHSQRELFICDVADAVLKDIMQHMEHPFYALSKRPDTAIRRYEHKGQWLEITPSVKGLATIYDKDILIYCISQIMAKLKRNEPVTQHVRITARDLLIFTNRGTSGPEYDALEEAIDRLAGTRISTNIQTGQGEEYGNFGLIDRGQVYRKPRGADGRKGRLVWCEVSLSDWVFRAIRAQEVLTLHPDYFRLRKPLEKRIYEVARKHCGQQAKWMISLPNLLKKTGARSPEKRFRQMIRGLATSNHLPDYVLTLDEDDMVTFVNRNTMSPSPELPQSRLHLSEEAYARARGIAPGWDVYAIEADWRSWMASGPGELPRDADAAFLGFCKHWAERKRDNTIKR
ncbi:replication initiator protein A [Rhodopirellula europaea]|uniref:Replication initiator protein A n=1 Tax=Rhodopirellula europaea 6C TaxID=1263867 RepID=M2AZ78_9BACT|nr:replication initiator protein A [Rhodopirellula europaea]EMB14853.1 Replication initiator protein A [Rhodopirellula europaea 6C]